MQVWILALDSNSMIRLEEMVELDWHEVGYLFLSEMQERALCSLPIDDLMVGTAPLRSDEIIWMQRLRRIISFCPFCHV